MPATRAFLKAMTDASRLQTFLDRAIAEGKATKINNCHFTVNGHSASAYVAYKALGGEPISRWER